jgi:hypothetical protein
MQPFLVNILDIQSVYFGDLSLVTMDTATNKILMLESEFLESFLGIPYPDGATREQQINLWCLSVYAQYFIKVWFYFSPLREYDSWSRDRHSRQSEWQSG